MLDTATDTGSVAHAIQLALTPAFLLTGMAGILTVVTGRLNRIIDRGRELTESGDAAPVMAADDLQAELHNLERRRYVVSAAITMCTLPALLVCIVTAGLFVEALTEIKLRWLIGILFTGSNVALVLGLGFFLREVYLSSRTVRIPTQFRGAGGKHSQAP